MVGGVSIRHQPEYLPSLAFEIWGGEGKVVFQSGISLSICLHLRRREIVRESVQRVSIRHQPEYLPSRVARNPPSSARLVPCFNQASA